MDDKRKDVFDRLMALPGLRVFSVFYKRHKTVLLYLLFGCLTTLISVGTFILFHSALGINELISNTISWLCAVSFAYVTNHIWVFCSSAKGVTALKEMFSFFAGRLITLAFEEAALLVFVTLLHYSGVVTKVAVQFAVLVLNYVFSKVIVFRKGEKMHEEV